MSRTEDATARHAARIVNLIDQIGSPRRGAGPTHTTHRQAIRQATGRLGRKSLISPTPPWLHEVQRLGYRLHIQ
jgi:hypothetical protein